MPATVNPAPAPAAPAPAGAARIRIPLPHPALPPGARAAALLWQCMALGAGFVLAGGRIPGGAAPFALACVLGCAPGYAPAVTVGAAAGSLALLPAATALPLLGALLAALGVRLWRREAFAPAALAAGAVLAAGQLAAIALHGATAAALLQAAVTPLAAAALGRAVRAWPPQTARGVCLWVGMLVACAQGLPLFGLVPGLTVLLLAGLTAAWGGAAQPYAACLVWAAALTAAQPALCGPALAAAAAVLAAGLCGGARRRMAGVAAAVFAVCAPVVPHPQPLFPALLSALLGAVLFAVLPAARLRALLPEPASDTARRPAPAGAGNAVAGRVSAVADALADVADTVDAVCERRLPPRGESFDFVVDYTARRLCRGCRQRERCWLQSYSGMVDGLYHLKAPLEARGRVEIEDLQGMLSACAHPSDLCLAVGHGYRLWRSRRQSLGRAAELRTALTDQYTAIAAALAQLAAQLEQTGLPDPALGAKAAQLFADIGLEALACEVSTDLYGRMSAQVTVARAAFTPAELDELAAELGRACRREFAAPQAHSHHAVTTLRFDERPLLRAVFGAANRPAAGQEVSGDAWEQFCDSAGRAQLLLCDGMGVGPAAAVDGRMAVRLVTRLLRAGLGAESAARLANTALGLKNSEQESGATLDLWTVDLYTGRAACCKAGAAPSFLIRDGVPRTVEAGGLPIGMLGTVSARAASLTLAAGDMLVLVSDGILADGPEWLLQQLAQSARLGQSPAQLAEAVLQAAGRRPGARRDDCTVLAVQLTAP